MNSLQKGIIVGALQCALALSLTGKLLYDRTTCPRVWVKANRYDPYAPIRGRYLSLVLAPETGAPYWERTAGKPVVFFVPEQRAGWEAPGNATELWAEVTIPVSGPPRPIRLGLKEHGQIQPIPVD